MDTSNITIERKHRVGEKSNDNERAIVVQFSFYKDKINILKNCRKVKITKISIFEDFSQETMQILKKNGRRNWLTENKVRFCAFSKEVLFARNGEHQHNRLSDYLS